MEKSKSKTAATATPLSELITFTPSQFFSDQTESDFICLASSSRLLFDSVPSSGKDSSRSIVGATFRIPTSEFEFK